MRRRGFGCSGCLMSVVVFFVVIVLIAYLMGYQDSSDSDKTTNVETTSTQTEEISAEVKSSDSQESEVEKQGVVGVEVAEPENPLDNFSYTISGNEVILDKYKGHNSILEINSSYNIDGIDYYTNLSDFQIGIGNSTVETVIFDEGITEVRTAVFNSTDVKRVFFPKSMTNVYDYTLSYLHPDDGEMIQIFYAGTQDDWSNIFTAYERTSISDAGSAGEIGESVADALNNIIGAGYDSSKFEYFFSASPDDLRI